MATVEERIRKITADILNVNASTIQLENHFGNDLGAESVQSIELVAAFSEEFDIEMDEEEALMVTTVNGAIKYITQVCQDQGKTV